MNKIQTPIKSGQTLKGFRDFLPKEAKKRQYVIDIVKRVFELYGFEPLETPALEYEEVLLGKYGEEGDKLMYRFTDNGGRKVALRYDQTVPTSRVVTQYKNDLQFPFKRYQIQPVWRAENTQKGRFREFLQCDADIIGTLSPLADAEVIATAGMCLNQLDFRQFKILINDRGIFDGLPKEAIIAIDKLKKIGKEKVAEELVAKGAAKTLADAASMIRTIEAKEPTPFLNELFLALEKLGMPKEFFKYAPTLARGLDYYTSTIFEIEIENYSAGSVCGGGRYDKLIGQLSSGLDMPATGFALGFDRIMEAMEELKLFPPDLAVVKVLVTVFSKELENDSVKIATNLREQGINTEVYLGDGKIDKQLKYADKKAVPYVVILGPNEVKNGTVLLKDMKTGEQKEIPEDSLQQELAGGCGNNCGCGSNC